MISLKPGCNPRNIQPELLLLIQLVASVYAKHGQDCTITSLFDDAPLRKSTSLHHRDGLCRAADFKTSHLPEYVRDLILSEVREAVGYLDEIKPRAYDFIFEASITHPDGRMIKAQHFHGEADSHFPAPVVPV